MRLGTAWVIVYRNGRAWGSKTVWSDVENDRWSADDVETAATILAVDPFAVILNGRHSERIAGNISPDEIAEGIRWNYHNGYNRLLYRIPEAGRWPY